MKRGALTLMLGTAVSVAVVIGGSREVGATCLGPEITVTPTRGAPGSAVVVRGRFFFSTCNDTSVNGVPPAPNSPDKGVAIAFVQDGRPTLLRRIDADSDGSFAASVAIPLTAHTGSAQFEASRPAGGVSQKFAVVARSGALAVTGSRATRLMLAGLALLACGFVLLTFGRRTEPTL